MSARTSENSVKAKFAENIKGEVRRTLPRTPVYEDMEKGPRLLAAPTPSRMLLG